jgi:hypothetical protein
LEMPPITAASATTERIDVRMSAPETEDFRPTS